jgi:hypothetical protein
VLLDAMDQELARNFSLLKAKADPAPYFLSYEVTEEDSHGVSATLGAITNDGQGKSRRLDVCVRVGTPKLDNYHRVRGERTQFTSGAPLTFEDQPDSIASGWRPIAPTGWRPSGSSRSAPMPR